MGLTMEENLYQTTYLSPLIYRMRIIVPIWKGSSES